MAKKKKRKKITQNVPGVPEGNQDEASGENDSALASQSASDDKSVSQNNLEADQSQPQSQGSTGAIGFFQGSKEELEKVVWPDRQQLISESVAVMLMVSLSAFLISFLDNIFGWISKLVF